MSSMVVWMLQLGLLSAIYLAESGQVESGGAPRPVSMETPGARESVGDGQVIADHLAIYDRPDAASFGMGMLERGDRVRVREWIPGGWAAIDPPMTAIGWVERASLELGGEVGKRGGSRRDPASPGLPMRTRVVVPRAVVRAGHLTARMPGPPWIELPRGTMVQLVDRPPLTVGAGSDATLWFAVVPPAEAACYVQADGLRDVQQREGVSEVLATYLVPEGGDPKSPGPAPGSLPPGVAAEIARVDGMHRTVLIGRPIERWQFDAVRAEYQAILKRSGDNPAVEEALRTRLARLTRHEQAAAAAREFQEVLARSRGRDVQVAQLQRQLTVVDRHRTTTYHAIGMVQPSSRLFDGRKLHALIGRDGKTVAYLDIPPGLDVEALGTSRVGVRGVVHYNQELGTRLITVRDLEPVGARR
jgi:hypothetical protein